MLFCCGHLRRGEGRDRVKGRDKGNELRYDAADGVIGNLAEGKEGVFREEGFKGRGILGPIRELLVTVGRGVVRGGHRGDDRGRRGHCQSQLPIDNVKKK